jgi:hypothetical protein
MTAPTAVYTPAPCQTQPFSLGFRVAGIRNQTTLPSPISDETLDAGLTQTSDLDRGKPKNIRTPCFSVSTRVAEKIGSNLEPNHHFS